MLPNARQEKIKELLQQKGSMKISELSRLLGVSEMTIHRDLAPLVRDGLLVKKFGGVVLPPAQNAAPDNNPPGANGCITCGRTVQDRLAYRLILRQDRVETACCAHCGLLRQRQLGDQVLQAICYDFFTHTTISAALAWFVMDTGVDIRCCQPQALTFERRDYAEGFTKGFGGRMYSFPEALEQIASRMNNTLDGCCGRG